MADAPVTLDFSKAIPISDQNPQAAELKQSVAYAVQQNPDEYAKQLQLQKQTGIPPAVSAGNLPAIQQAADANKLDPHVFTMLAPRVSGWATDPHNAAVSGVDEVHRLGTIEQHAATMRTTAPQGHPPEYSLWADVKDMLAHPVETLLGADTPRMAAEKQARIARVAQETGDPFLKSVLQVQEFTQRPLLRVTDSAAFQRHYAPNSENVFSRAVTGATKVVEGLTSPDNISLLASLPLAPEDVSPLLSGVFSGQMTEGAASSGVDAARAAARGDIGTAAELATGALASGAFAVASGKHALVDHIGAQLSAGDTSTVGRSDFIHNLAQSILTSEGSKLRERSPEHFHDALQTIFAGDESLRIPADKFTEYFQSKQMDPAAVAGQIGAANFGEAVVSGGDIEVPKADFLAKLDPEHQKGLLADIVDPTTGLTVRQHQDARDELQKWVAEGGPEKLQADAAAADAETASSPELQAVKEDLRQRYVDAGETPEVAETLAAKDANVYANLAKSAGMKPAELLQYYNPKIVEGEAPGAALHQGPTDAQIEAALRDKIAGDFEGAVREYSALPDTKGGRQLNTDDARELSEHYRADRSRSAAVHEPASQFIKDLYAKKLAEPVAEGRDPLVLFTAGGTGAGKSSSLKTSEGTELEQSADIIYDTNMNKFASADLKIQQALDSGRDVHIQYTYREPVEALVNGALPRAMRMGRTVPMVEHIKTHVGARAVIDELRAKYADDPRVEFSAVDNSRGRGNQQAIALDAVPQIDDNGLSERLHDALAAEHKAGRISETVRNGFAKAGIQPESGRASAKGKDARADARESAQGVSEGLGTLYQSKPAIPGADGRTTPLLTPSGKIDAKYRLVEAADLVPSHNPHTFEVNKAYPEGVQERAYDKSKEAQARVIDQAQNYEPAYTVNTNPDAVNGPPVITPDGIVLGGNSRAMATTRLYADGRGDVYRNALREQAGDYGLKPEDVDGMKEPVLVRQVEAPDTLEGMRRLGSDLNRSMTGALGAAEKAVSVGKNITPDTLRWVSDELNTGDSTLREFLGAKGGDVLRRLVADGALTERERPQYVDPATGGLNESGKSFVEKALLGSVFDDPRLLESAPKSITAKIERSLGSITSFAARPDEWNILPALRAAIAEHGAIQRSGSSVELRLGQTDMFGEGRNPLVDALVRALDGKPNAVREAFESYARDSDANLPGQARMFGSAEPFDAFNTAFGSKLTAEDYHNGLVRAGVSEPAVIGTHANDVASVPEQPTADAGTGGKASGGDARPEAAASRTAEVATPRGWFRILPDGTYEIGRTKIGDLSTFVHEPAHGYLQIIRDLATRDNASDTIRADYRRILEFLGAKDGEPLTREQHEQWARANEQYLREGKAPSDGLKGVFQRFAIWLGSIYKKASDLGVELTDDIRGVFDRLYAAEEGVNRAARETGPRLFESPEDAGWTEEQFKFYADSLGLAVDEAKAQIVAKLNDAALRERSDEWREEEKVAREAVTAQVDRTQEYVAIRSLRRGTLDDGTPITLNREAMVKKFGEERVKELQQLHPGLYRAEGGVDPETAAEVLGFNSAAEMMGVLRHTPRRSEAIETGVRDHMTAKYGDIRYDGSLTDQARLAVENQRRAENLHRELKALQKKIPGLKAADRIAPLETYQDAARQMIDRKPLTDVQPSRYLTASREYSRKAFDALRSGKLDEAVQAKHKELLNHFLFREATEARTEADKAQTYAKKFSRAAVRDRMAKAGGEDGQHVYLDQIDNLLDLFHMGNKRPAATGPRQPFTEFAAEQQARALADFYALNPDWAKDHPGETPEIPQMVDTSITDFAGDYRKLSIAELRQVTATLKNIETLAKNAYGFIRDGKRVSFAQEVADFERVARERKGEKPVPRSGTDYTAKENAIRALQGVDAYMQKVEWLVDALDGGDIDGPARRNIKKPIDDAWGKSLEMGDDIFSKLEKLVDARPKEDVRDLNELTDIQFPHFDRPLTRKQLISWALNLGTEENQKVALIGEGLIGSDGRMSPLVDQALGTLRTSELKWIQGVWDILDGMLPAVREKALRTTGIDPKLKKVASFSVTSADGEKVQMRGGYYPLKAEPGDRVGRKQTDPANLLAVGYQSPKTNTSHLQRVTGATYRLQLNYESVLSRHLADVINDTTKGEAVAQVYKFISNDGVRSTIRETLGEQYEPEFLKWLQDFAVDNKGAAHDSSPLLDWLLSRRSGMVAARLGGNLGSYLIQVGDVFKSIADPDVKTSYLAKAFLDIRRSPTKTIEMIRELSPNEMRFREKHFNREIRDMLTEKSAFDHKRAIATEFLMQGFAVMDRLVTFPAWLARYRQGLAEHGDSPRAAREADRTIARDYQAGDNRNMSRMMRQGGWTRLVTTFQGDANTWYGIISSSVHSGSAKNISVGLMALVMEQVVGQYIKNRGPKDDENKAGWFTQQALLAGVGKIPVFGDVAQYGLSKLTGQYASLQNPTMQALEKTATAPGSIYSYVQGNKDGQQVAQDLTEATGIYLGVPGTSQAIRTWKYIHNVQTGKEPEPRNPVEAVRGAVGGSNRKR